MRMIMSLEVPTNYLKEFEHDVDFHFVLAHLVHTNKDYRDFYASMTNFKLLDNGVHENGHSMEAQALLDAADAIGAGAIIPPDELFNKNITLHGWANMATS